MMQQHKFYLVSQVLTMSKISLSVLQLLTLPAFSFLQPLVLQYKKNSVFLELKGMMSLLVVTMRIQFLHLAGMILYEEKVAEIK